MPIINRVITTPEALVDLLRADARRHVYDAGDGSLWVSDGGGMVASMDAVTPLIESGVLRQQWPDVEGSWILSSSAES